MTEIIVVILGIALLLYVLLGGADFGAGILELFTGGKASGIVTRAIAPVWEANHVWLILVVVILFVGFPLVYSTILTVFHIPVLLALIGIIMRGSAFTFRHYDIDEETPKAIYSAIFRWSSLFTTFFLGITLGGIILGKITLDYSQGFYNVYIAPWLNWFCMSIGIFLILLFSFLANIYVLGEAKEQEDINRFSQTAKWLIVFLVVSGAVVFLTAEIYDHQLFSEFYSSVVSVSAIVLSTIAMPFLWMNLKARKPNLVRFIAGFQTTMIVTGWFAIQFPVIVTIQGGQSISVYNSSAPQQTQFYMLIALVVGILIIFPSMAYLYKTFKFNGSSH